MIATREVTYDVDGLTMVAHLAQPDGEGPWPAVLIGHDGIGLDDYQRGRADDLARHGYIAAPPINCSRSPARFRMPELIGA